MKRVLQDSSPNKGHGDITTVRSQSRGNCFSDVIVTGNTR